jgi:single-stranded-DNA-specific exonuclease
MSMARKITWEATQNIPSKEITLLSEELDLEEPILKLLLQRGIKSAAGAQYFFKPSLTDLHDPLLMKDMNKAVQRISTARAQSEKILIYGDYDVDGTTSVALMANFLDPIYANFETYIPDRYKEGYGISKQGIDYASSKEIRLIIALDCGIKANDLVAYAQNLGIDFIICDHHTPGPELPLAAAVLDPKREDCFYPYKGLSGCGVGFKLCQALSKSWGIPDDLILEQLDLLALSIGADIVPITGENRILAYHGMKKINSKPSDGIKALLKVSNFSGPKLTISDVVFTLAPRINAAGRLADAQKAVSLMRGTDLSILPALAVEIESRNKARKELDRKITLEALKQIEEEGSDRHTNFVYQADWHKGVIGIVASRLIETHYKPTVVLTNSGADIAGSARSVVGFDLYEALEACTDSLQQFGGHPAAAGMTLNPEQLEQFKQAFEESVKERILPEQMQAKLFYNLEVKLDTLSDKFYRLLQYFEPFGPGNLAPTLLCRNLNVHSKRYLGADKQHLKLELVDAETGCLFSAIGFNMGHHKAIIAKNEAIDILAHLELNHYRGTSTKQLRLLDIKLNSDLKNPQS